MQNIQNNGVCRANSRHPNDTHKRHTRTHTAIKICNDEFLTSPVLKEPDRLLPARGDEGKGAAHARGPGDAPHVAPGRDGGNDTATKVVTTAVQSFQQKHREKLQKSLVEKLYNTPLCARNNSIGRTSWFFILGVPSTCWPRVSKVTSILPPPPSPPRSKPVPGSLQVGAKLDQAANHSPGVLCIKKEEKIRRTARGATSKGGSSSGRRAGGKRRGKTPTTGYGHN